MHKPADLIAAAGAVISATATTASDRIGMSETVLAAGVFGHALPSNAELATAAAAASSLPHGGDSVVGGVIGAIENVTAMNAVQAMDAQRDGLAVRMLVAVTDSRIYLLDWTPGSGPKLILKTMDRTTTDVTVQHFGLSRRIELLDHGTGVDAHIVGTTAMFSAEAPGDKAVLSLLEP